MPEIGQSKDKAKSLFENTRLYAAKANVAFTLTLAEYTDLIQSSCKLCGAKAEFPQYNLLFLRNFKQGFIPVNILSACYACKSCIGKMHVERFIEHAKKIYQHVGRPALADAAHRGAGAKNQKGEK